jgi:hypothetical protein
MLDSVGLRHEMDAPSIRQSLIACTHYHEPSFFMSRSQASRDSDSGWFIGCRRGGHNHQEPANLKCISLYEAYLNQRALQGFASFPVGSIISVDRENGLKLFKNDAALDIVPGSFLDQWFKKQAL